MNFGFYIFLVFGSFWVIFEFLKFLKMFLEWEWVTLGVYLVTFIQILNFSFFEFFWFFWGFFGSFLSFWNSQKVFGMRMGDFGRVYLVTFIHSLPPSAFFGQWAKSRWIDGWLYVVWMDIWNLWNQEFQVELTIEDVQPPGAAMVLTFAAVLYQSCRMVTLTSSSLLLQVPSIPGKAWTSIFQYQAFV